MNLPCFLWVDIPIVIICLLLSIVCCHISRKEMSNYFDMSNEKLSKKIEISFILSYVIGLIFFYLIKSSYVDTLTIVPLLPLFMSHILIDIKSMELPDKLNLTILIIAIFRLIYLAIFNGFSEAYIAYALSCLTTSAIMFIVYLILACLTGGALGGGDIKLVTALGLFLTKASLAKFLLFPFIIGAIISTYLLIFKKAKKEEVFPFGPSILISFILIALI